MSGAAAIPSLSKAVAFSLATVLLSGCAMLPRSGPYRSDLVNISKETDGRIAFVKLDLPTAERLAQVPEPTLQGSFGDYRPPETQRIGVGDVVQITLWEAGSGGLFAPPSSPSSPYPGSHSVTIPDQVVAGDGSVTVPFAGRVPVVGRTPPQVEQDIVARLAGKADDPQALVTVVKNHSSTVTVMGDVGPGALIPLNVRGEKLLSVIAEAGGIRAPVSDIVIALSRGDRTVRVPMEEVLNSPRQDIYVRPGDQITLIRDPQTFTVMGATGRNAVIPFGQRRITLDEALAKAGGILDYAANPAGVFVLRFEPEATMRLLPQAEGHPVARNGVVPVVYLLNMRKPQALFTARRFVMHNKDIVYVSDAPVVDIQKVLGLFGQIVQPAVTGLTLQNATK